MSLTREQILAAARDVVGRHGPAKATVVDVAQALGVSHGSIYRFFPTKAALREAVVADWLDQIVATLPAPNEGSALEGLKAWFVAYRRAKIAQRARSPELFEAFRVLSAEEPAVLAGYKARLVSQIAAFLDRGMAAGELRSLETTATARVLLNATLKFHHPAFARDWDAPETHADFEVLWTLLTRGLTPERNAL